MKLKQKKSVKTPKKTNLITEKLTKTDGGSLNPLRKNQKEKHGKTPQKRQN